MTVSGDFTVTGQSALAGTGAFTTQGASTINIGAQTSFFGLVGGKGWTNQGTITVGGDDRILFGFSAGGTNTLTNAAGATLNLTSTFSTPIDFFTGTATLNNAGTLNQTFGGAHTISGGIVFNNTGTVNVDTGTLTIAGGGTTPGHTPSMQAPRST